MSEALQSIANHWGAIFRPPPRMTVSEWANEFRFLSSESSSNPGKYSSAMTPYAVEWMDSVHDPESTGTVLMVGSQLGKTECMGNIVGYFIDIEPTSILMVQPTIDLAESWSKERLAPMIRDTPALAGKVSDPRSRDSGNTMLHKIYPGGNIAMAGANAPSGLASRPRRVVLLDEEDRFPISAGTEGDPASLAIRRTETFWNAVVVETSTPTVKGVSRIEARYEESDQRRLFCPCPHCGHAQTLKWAMMRFDESGDGSDAVMQCESCHGVIDDEQRRGMVMNGKWIAEFPKRKLRGYHLNGMASLFRHKRGYVNRLHQMVAEHLSAKRKGREVLRTWVNTFLAETWEEDGESVNWQPLMDRREDWGEFPEGGLILTAGVDIQGDRFEFEIVAWGDGEESWSVEHGSIMGDFNNADTQSALDEILEQKFIHPSGVEMSISATFIDSGHKTKSVYSYTKRRQAKRIYACKGVGGAGQPIISRPTKRGIERATLFSVGTDTAKELIYSRITGGEKGAGYMHFPLGRPEDYFRQLCAEQKYTRYKNGVPFTRFENPSKARNEALDIRVYALAALSLLRVNWKKLKESIGTPKPKEAVKADKEYKIKLREERRAGGWVNNW